MDEILKELKLKLMKILNKFYEAAEAMAEYFTNGYKDMVKEQLKYVRLNEKDNKNMKIAEKYLFFKQLERELDVNETKEKEYVTFYWNRILPERYKNIPYKGEQW